MSKEFGLTDLLEELFQDRGFDFRGYKRTSLERRFRKRMFQLSIPTYAAYRDFIREHPDEVDELLNTILINVTQFFRDPPAWEILRTEIMPPVLGAMKPGSVFRAWSAGCASGEEAYSIAILLTELLGPRIQEFDVKVYATDVDDQALAAARRGEYSGDALRHMRPEWREKYFHGTGLFRVNRDIRRLVIFGKGNLAQDAPISHVGLLLCRNVLIYFNSDLQGQVIPRLRYALDPGGILFLGKSESQLTNSTQFRRLNPRWRMFQRISPAPNLDRTEERMTDERAPSPLSNPELNNLRRQQRYLLETLRQGVLILGPDGTITHANPAAFSNYGLPALNVVGKRLQDTEFCERIPDLASQLRLSQLKNQTVNFKTRIRIGDEERILNISIRPMPDERGVRNGTFIYCDDNTLEEKLQTTVEELESTSEELQSSNEELETTNEELQSTNEELESLNEELETTNQELDERTKHLDQLNSVYQQTLEKIRLPVLLVNKEGRIEFWNGVALRMFGFRSKPPMDLMLDQLPIAPRMRKLIEHRHAAALLKNHPVVARRQPLGGKDNFLVDIHFSLIPSEGSDPKVLVMFEPQAKDERHNQPQKKMKNARAKRPLNGRPRNKKK
ncbi:MAG TPA: CheR family methyltransferase [Terriglobales bacterium]|nr:CheR family methyltransferase [Terriglobales bacterium]